jgi:hypothetical protein
MRVQIKDRDALAQLSLVDVRAYLTSQGWHAKGRYGSVATIYARAGIGGRESEILLPIREELGDYAVRMGEVVEALSEVEGRTQLSVFADLIKSGFDVLRFRAIEADGAGTIALEHGVSLYDHARDLMAAASNAAIKPKRAYRGAMFDQTRDYLHQLRLGQTEVGSYVLTVLSPVPPALETEQTLLFPDLAIGEEPFPRLVTRTLDRALKATKAAVSEAAATGKLDPFEGVIEAGVSGNLCEAVARLAEQGSGVDITISWSRVRPPPGPVATHTFTQDNARVLSEAASTFRDLEPQTDTTIEGFVIGLYREPEDFDGKAKIRGFVDGKVRTITAEFLHADYQRVLEAHEQKLRVRVDGDLIKRGPFQTLQSARNLVVFEEEDTNPTLAFPES